MKNKPIYPTPVAGGDHSVVTAHQADDLNNYESGMTLREHYAGLAMQGLLASQSETYGASKESTARIAVEHADALLTELNKES